MHHSSYAVHLFPHEIPVYLEQYLEDMMRIATEVSATQSIVDVMLYELSQQSQDLVVLVVRKMWISSLREFCYRHNVVYPLDMAQSIKRTSPEVSSQGNNRDNKQDISCAEGPRNDFPFAI